jgi:hypothetical protein
MGAGNHRGRIKVTFGLFKSACGKPKPNRRAIGLLHVMKGMAHQDRQFIRMRGFIGNQPILRHADQGRIDALVLATFWRQGQARGR